ncbi:MAG: hypothetical protein IJU21_02045 [Bacteroidales bacterium]|nr:hypothetical protein [Bacteroidales bacterium]
MSDQIPEIQVLLMQVEARFGGVNRSTDFENLSYDIENATQELLSASTLKRLWGYVNYLSNPRLNTLDVLSRYVGYKDFGSFCEQIHSDPEFVSGFLSEDSLAAQDLPVGSHIRIGWDPDRIVDLEYLGDNRFEVVGVQNASLRMADRFILPSIVKGFPIYIPHIERDGRQTPMYVAGYRGGITLIKKL